MNFRHILYFISSGLLISLCIVGLSMIIQKYTGFDLMGTSYTSIGVYALVYGFTGAIISLLISRWVAKWSMQIELYNPNEVLGNQSVRLAHFYRLIERMAMSQGIKTPEFGIYESDEVNAFATGPSKDRSLIALSTGLLNGMTDDEVEGVIAHEMAHIINGDMVGMTLVSGLINAFVIFWSRIITMAINNATDGKLGPIAGGIVYFVISILISIPSSLIVYYFSRVREYKADKGAGELVGKNKMIAALQKLKLIQERGTSNAGVSDNKYALLGISGGEEKDSLFSTHPSLDNRIRSLRGY